MKILHIIQGIDASLGGLPAAMQNIIRVEKVLQIQSSVLSVSSLNDIQLEVPVHKFAKSFPKRLTNSRDAISWLKSNIEHFDLVVIHGVWNVICIRSAAIAMKKKVRYILWPHGSLDPFDIQKKAFAKRIIGRLFLKKIFNNATCICCTSQLEMEIIEVYGSTVRKDVLPLPVKPPGYVISDGTAFRDKFNFTADDFILLFLGRITFKKQVDLILSALSELSKKFPTVKLAIVGPLEDEYTHMKQLVDQLNLGSKVVFCGELKGTEKSEAFSGANCFVLPSLNENFGIAVVESLQHCLPVVISKNVYIWKEVISYNAGWVCESNVRSVIDTITCVLTYPDDYLLKVAGSKVAGNSYTPDKLLSKYSNFYDSILA